MISEEIAPFKLSRATYVRRAKKKPQCRYYTPKN